MPIFTYVKNADPKSKVTGIELEGGLTLYLGTYANLTAKQLEQIYRSGMGIILEEGIIPPAANAGSTTASGGTIIPPWSANTLYRQYQVTTHEEKIYIAKKEFESGSVFKEENWELIGSGGGGGVTEKKVEEIAESKSSTKLAKAENLKDVADAGSSRANVHIPVLTPVQCVSTSNVASLSGEPTFDGFKATEGQVLLTAQAEAKNNGIWNISVGAWTRPTEFANELEIKSRSVLVINGTVYKKTIWFLNTSGIIKVGTTSQVWEKISSPISEPKEESLGEVGASVEFNLAENRRLFKATVKEAETEIKFKGFPVIPNYAIVECYLKQGAGGNKKFKFKNIEWIGPEPSWELIEGKTNVANLVVVEEGAKVYGYGEASSLPVGGMTGQSLVKKSGVNYETKWESVPTYAQVAESQPFPVKLPESYGALGNGKLLADAEIESTKKILQSPSAPFTAADKGKYIAIVAAGEEAKIEGKTPAEKGGYYNEHPQWNTLTSRISEYKGPEEIELEVEAKHTVKGVLAVYATDDTVAIQEAINNAVKEAKEGAGYCEVWFHHTIYGVAGELKTGGETEGNAQITLPIVGSSGGRFTDGVTKSASKKLTSATANFKFYDKGAELISAGKIKAGTIIENVLSNTEVEMSGVAEAEASGVTVIVAATRAQKQSMKITINLKGSNESSGLPQWYQTVPQQAGACLFSFGPRAAGETKLVGIHAQPEYSLTNGRPSMIGGPTPNKGYTYLRFSNMMVVVTGLTISAPSNSTVSGIDLAGVSNANINSLSSYALGVPGLIGEAPGANLNEFVIPWAGYEKEFIAHKKAAVALGMPGHGNNDNSYVTQHSVEGHTGAIEIGEHGWHSAMRSVYCLIGVIPQSEHWFWSSTIGYLSIEDTIFPIYVPSGYAEFTLNINMLDAGGSEGRWGQFRMIDDEGNAMKGVVYANTIVGGITGAKLVKVINVQYPPGNAVTNGFSAQIPAVPASKSFATNTFYRDAQVVIKAKASSSVKVTVDGLSEFTGKPTISTKEVKEVAAVAGRNSSLNNLKKGAILKGTNVEGFEVKEYNSGTKILTVESEILASPGKVTIVATAEAKREIPESTSQEVFVPSGATISLTYPGEAPTWDWDLL
jgi:hypothetical protein